jgi:hypothetical protein
MQIYGGVFLTSVLAGEVWSTSRPGGGWVDPRTGLDDVVRRKILPLSRLELRPLGLAARSHSLYRWQYPGSRITNQQCHLDSVADRLLGPPMLLSKGHRG